MRYLVFLFPFLLLGCASSTTSCPRVPAPGQRTSVISVGMPFADAIARLEAQNAHTGMMAFLLTKAAERKGIEIHQYVLPNGRVLLLNSALGKDGRVVSSISFSTYAPKSFDCLMDPEHQKFLDSFERRNEFDLEEPMLGDSAALAPASGEAAKR